MDSEPWSSSHFIFKFLLITIFQSFKGYVSLFLIFFGISREQGMKVEQWPHAP